VSAAAGFSCPSEASRESWVGPEKWGDRFAISQSGTRLTVRRTDSRGGWGMNLKITCVRSVSTPGSPHRTAAPSATPSSKEAAAAQRTEKALDNVSCQVLAKMSMGKSCENKKVVEKVDVGKVEEEALAGFYLRQGSTVFVSSSRYSTFMQSHMDGEVNGRAQSVDTSIIWEVVAPGGGEVYFGDAVWLRSQCTKAFLAARNGLLETISASNSAASARFVIFNGRNMGDRSRALDASTVVLKAYDGRWVTASAAGTFTAHKRAVGSEEHLVLSKVKHTSHKKC